MSELEVFKQSLDVSRIVMAFTIVMTLVSIVFSALTLAFQRSHNRRTVKPYCCIKRSRAGGVLRIVIRNAGLGPLFVDELRLMKEGEALPLDDLEAYLERSGSGSLDDIRHSVLTPTEEAAVVEIGGAESAQALFALLESGKIEVSYHDIYEKEYRTAER